MQIVVTLSEREYNLMQHFIEHGVGNAPMEAICNGQILPKGHGRLIDADKLCQTPIDSTDLPIGECLMVYDLDEIENAPAIIEADKSESEVKK